MRLYRRNNVSISCSLPRRSYGNNFYIWYGYSGSLHSGMILDAHMVKNEMSTNLSLLDHSQIVLDSCDDWVTMLVQISEVVYRNAMHNNRSELDEIWIEDCYGDIIQKNRKNSTVTIPFMYYPANNEVLFLFEDDTRSKWVGRDVKNYYVTFYETHISLNELRQFLEKYFLKGKEVQKNFIVSYIDNASRIVQNYSSKWKGNVLTTILCREHIEHSLSDIVEIGKCAQTHGHSYLCYTTVFCTNVQMNSMEFVCGLDADVRTALKSAVEDLKNTATSENIVCYIWEKLYREYNIQQIRLKETDNIMVIKSRICEE